jgi:hypothetical protein
MKLFELIALLSLVILLGGYIGENWFSSKWSAYSKPMTLGELLRDWVIFMLLFSGLEVLLNQALRLACRTVC